MAEEKDTKTTAESGAPKWFSLSLAANPEIMNLANACRKAALQLQNALNAVKTGAEIAKTLMLLQANAIALILNAIADELEKLYNDLYNAGFYAITLTGQEGDSTGFGDPATVKMTKSELQKREDNASAYKKGLEMSWEDGEEFFQKWTGANLLQDQFFDWAEENVKGYKRESGAAAMEESFDVKIDTYSFVSAFESAGFLSSLKRQTPNQFMAKIQQKLQDSNDPNTPTFSSSAPVAALIGLVGVPDVPQLQDFVKIL